MATQTITVTDNTSAEIEVSGSQLVFHIKFAKADNFTIQRCIETCDWVNEVSLRAVDFNYRVDFEKTISGLVPEQKLRFVFDSKAEVESLTVLQS